MSISNTIGLLGGTFDPIHAGHVKIAKIALQTCQLDQVQFIPNFQSPTHSRVSASAQQRLDMVKLAINDTPKFVTNDIEIRRRDSSYTIDTLKALRKQYPDASLCFILGEDAFNSLTYWHGYQHIPDYCHLIVISRATQSLLPDDANEGLMQHITENKHDLHQSTHGKIVQITIPTIDICATQIRTDLDQGHRDKLKGLPSQVYDYIVAHHLYGVSP